MAARGHRKRRNRPRKRAKKISSEDKVDLKTCDEVLKDPSPNVPWEDVKKEAHDS
jgi:hypothetical protein